MTNSATRSSRKLRVLIIDGYASVRGFLRMFLEQEGFEILAEAGSGTEGMRFLEQQKPDLVILELVLPEMSGLDLLRYLRSEIRSVRVILFSSTGDRELIREALAEQPHAFVHKGDSLAVLKETLRLVGSGSRHFGPFATALMDQYAPSSPRRAMTKLSGRERAVLQMVAEGRSNQDIAHRLCVSGRTVEHYRTQLRRKLDRHDVASLTRYAVRHGLVPLD